MKFFKKKKLTVFCFLFLFSLIICQNTAPTCTSFTVSTGISTQLNINFSSNVSDSQDTPTQLKVIIKSLASSGSLKSGQNSASVDGQYTLSALSYIGQVSGTYTITFIALDSGNLQSVSTCTLTINVCYLSCDSCSQVGSSTNNYCSTCKSGYFKSSDSPTNCYNSVPVNYYFNSASSIYKPCYSSCLSCSSDGDATNNNCFTCKSGYYKKSDYSTTNCFNTTPSGFYLDTSVNLWKACNSACATCEREANSVSTNCLTCNTNYYKLSDNPTICLNTEPAFYYFNSSTNLYKPCYNSCNRCSTDGTELKHNCITCRPNFYPKSDDLTMCFSLAPDFYYLDQMSNRFKKCHINCKSCTIEGTGYENKCISCKDGLYPKSDNTSNCFDGKTSLPNYYFDSTSLVPMFKPCYESCSRCSGAGNFFNHNCLSCQSNLYSKIGEYTQCYQFAPKGYYLDKKMYLYLKCYDSCLTCETSGDDTKNNCLSCKESEFFFKDPKNSSQCIKNTSYNFNTNYPGEKLGDNDILQNSEYLQNMNILSSNLFYTFCSSSSDNSTGNSISNSTSILKIQTVTPIYFQKNKTIVSRILFNNILDGKNPLKTISKVTAQNLKTNEIFDFALDKVDCNQLSVSINNGLQKGNYYLFVYDLKGNKIQSGFNLQVSSYSLDQDLEGIQKTHSNSIKSITQDRNQTILSEVINLSSDQNRTLIVHLYNSSLDLKNTTEGDDLSKELSSISLEESCLNLLKNNYKTNEDLIYAKVDYSLPELNISNSSSNNYFNNITAVDFNVYDKIGNLYDLSLCRDLFKIYLPVKNSNINIPLAREFSANFNKANLYDLNDPFYTDLCFTYSYNTNIFKTVYTSIKKNNVTYSSNNLTDMPLKYRRSLFYKNITISCSSKGHLCNFKGFVNNMDYAICECYSDSNIGFSQISLNYTEMPLDEMDISPLQSIRCNTWVFNVMDANLGGNIGFILMTSLLGVCFGLTLLVGIAYDPYKLKSNRIIFRSSNTKIEAKNLNLQGLPHMMQPKPVGAGPIFEEEHKNIKDNKKDQENIDINQKKQNLKEKKIIECQERLENIDSLNHDHLLYLNNQNSTCNNNLRLETEGPLKKALVLDENFLMKRYKHILVEKYKDINPNSISLEIRKEIFSDGLDRRFTYDELDHMSYKEAILFDERIFWDIYFHLLHKYHIFLSIFYMPTANYRFPVHIRIFIFLMKISFDFGFNTFFFTNEYLDKRYLSTEVKDFNYVWNFEFLKSLLSFFMASILTFILILIIYPSKSDQNYLKKTFTSGDKEKINEEINKYHRKMKCRYFIFFLISTILLIATWYISSCFTGTFTNTQLGWVFGGIISVILTLFVFDLIVPFMMALNRSISLHFELK